MINLTTEKTGFAVAIDGPVGVGKSTVAREVARRTNMTYIDTGAMYRAVALYNAKNNIDPHDEAAVTAALPGINISLSGQRVLLNGQDIRRYNREDYYNLFTAVFQDFNILPVSISDNLTSQPADKVDTSRLNHSLEMAGLTEKIASLPNGIDSLLVKDVHLDATEFSGGETQRLMLARALYKDAPLLILDEPTAALDPIAESQLYERYNELSKGRTSVYISHRLASTRFCDRIILIDGKAIAEEGTHDTLMAQGGKYAELFDIQSKYYQDEEVGIQ